MKRNLTLLELTIALMIVGIVAAFCCVRGKFLVDKYTYDRDAKKVARALEMAQAMSLAYQADVEVVIQQNEEGVLTLSFLSDEPPLKDLYLFQKKEKLDQIDKIFLNAMSEKKHVITYYGTGLKYPGGELTLYSKNQDLTPKTIRL